MYNMYMSVSSLLYKQLQTYIKCTCIRVISFSNSCRHTYIMCMYMKLFVCKQMRVYTLYWICVDKDVYVYIYDDVNVCEELVEQEQVSRFDDLISRLSFTEEEQDGLIPSI